MIKNGTKALNVLRPAATIILIRSHGEGFQVYLLKRNEKSGFMGGYYVFPGGMLDAEDRETAFWRRHVDLSDEKIVKRLGGEGLVYEEILAYSVAAIRETFEEAGAMLAFREQQRADDLKKICSRRLTAQMPRDWLKQHIVSGGWVLTLSRLKRWAHWITPVLMRKRFDTRFFLTVLPADHLCRPDRRETTHGIWVDPHEGMTANLKGTIPLSPPTLITLHQLSRYRRLTDLVKEADARKWEAPLFPRLIPMKNGAVIIEPWDPLYQKEEITVDSQRLEKAVLPVGAPFSRIWLSGGIWRAVASE